MARMRDADHAGKCWEVYGDRIVYIKKPSRVSGFASPNRCWAPSTGEAAVLFENQSEKDAVLQGIGWPSLQLWTERVAGAWFASTLLTAPHYQLSRW